MVEILKQDIFQPLPFERQVMIIFAGNEGYLDDIPLYKIKDFEKGFLAFLDKNYPDVEHEVREKKAISDEGKKKLAQAVTKFKEQFK